MDTALHARPCTPERRGWEVVEQYHDAGMAEITKLRAENARLRSSENNAHSVLREIYNDPDAPQGVRVKAVGLALQHETPRLTPVPPPLELVKEPDYLPLAEVVRLQRARADRMLAEQKNIRVLPNGQVYTLDDEGNGGND
jgi:hypothetical protein